MTKWKLTEHLYATNLTGLIRVAIMFFAMITFGLCNEMMRPGILVL